MLGLERSAHVPQIFRVLAGEVGGDATAPLPPPPPPLRRWGVERSGDVGLSEGGGGGAMLSETLACIAVWRDIRCKVLSRSARRVIHSALRRVFSGSCERASSSSSRRESMAVRRSTSLMPFLCQVYSAEGEAVAVAAAACADGGAATEGAAVMVVLGGAEASLGTGSAAPPLSGSGSAM